MEREPNKKNNIYSSIRLSIYTGGFLDAKISKDTQGEWFVSKQLGRNLTEK